MEQENQLISLLDKFGFTTAKGHYEQAVAAHSRGEWAAANAQLRTFVEEFFNKTQAIVCPGHYSSSNERKIVLAKAGFFIKEYNEYLFNGTGFVEGPPETLVIPGVPEENGFKGLPGEPDIVPDVNSPPALIVPKRPAYLLDS